MYNFETTTLIIGLLAIYPPLFITRPKVLAAGETEDEYAQRFKANNLAVVVFSFIVMLGVIYNATFY